MTKAIQIATIKLGARVRVTPGHFGDGDPPPSWEGKVLGQVNDLVYILKKDGSVDFTALGTIAFLDGKDAIDFNLALPVVNVGNYERSERWKT